MSSITRVPRQLVVAWAALLISAALVITRGARHDWINGDTRALVAGLPGISRCLNAGRFSDCNQLPGIGGSAVSKFPLIQTLPGYLIHESGTNASTVIAGLATINVIAVVVFTVMLARWGYRRGGLPLAVVATFILVPGMLVAYANQAFGEALSGVAFGTVVLVALRPDRVSRLLLPAAAVATVTKEIAAPLVFVFAIAALFVVEAGRAVIRRGIIEIASGSSSACSRMPR